MLGRPKSSRHGPFLSTSIGLRSGACGVPKLGSHPEKSAICRQDANFGTPHRSAAVFRRATTRMKANSAAKDKPDQPVGACATASSSLTPFGLDPGSRDARPRRNKYDWLETVLYRTESSCPHFRPFDSDRQHLPSRRFPMRAQGHARDAADAGRASGASLPRASPTRPAGSAGGRRGACPCGRP